MNCSHSEKEIKSLLYLSSLVNSSLEISDVISNSMRAVEELMCAERSAIFEIDHDKNDLFFRHASGDLNGYEEIRIKMGEGVAGWVAYRGEPLVVPDTAEDGRFSDRLDGLTSYNTRSIVAVPVKRKGQVTGVIEVINLREPFSAQSVKTDLLIIAAGHIGAALENASLYDRLRKKYVLARDELEEAQVKLLQAERLAALGKLSQGVAHVVRNPLMSIGGFTRRLKKKFGAHEASSDYFELILEETERLEKIVDAVGIYASMADPALSKVGVSELVSSVVERAESVFDFELVETHINHVREDFFIDADVNLIRDAVEHILRNASEAMQGRGRITISSLTDSSNLMIAIRDFGPGISTRDEPFLFDPFFTTKTYGAGLGLTAVHRILTSHGGEVKLFSHGDSGTEVCISLPVFS